MSVNWMEKDLGPVTAYAEAVAGGYTGTREQFEADMGNSATNATMASTKALVAEGYANGKQNGEAVDSESPYYQNNAEFFKTAAETAAASASAAYGTALLAPNYSTSATYAVGDHVIYNGNYYVCNTAITTAESWTAAHWTQVTVGKEAGNLKSAFKRDDDSILSVFDGCGENITYTQTAGSISGDVGDTISFSSSTSWKHTDIAVEAGEVYRISVSSRATDIYYVTFTNASGVILAKDCKFGAEYARYSTITFLITVPNINGIAKLYTHGNIASTANPGVISIQRVDKIADYVEEKTGEAIEAITEPVELAATITDSYEKSKNNIIGTKINDTNIRLHGTRSVTSALIYDCINGQDAAFVSEADTVMEKNIEQGKYVCHVGDDSVATISYTNDTVGNRQNLIDGAVFEVPEEGGSLFVRLRSGSVGDVIDFTLNFAIYEYGKDCGLISGNRIAADYVARNMVEELKNEEDSIPDYYYENDYLPGKESAINELYNRTNQTVFGTDPVDSIQFVFLTDYHYDPASGDGGDNNTRNSARLIKHIMDSTGVSFILFGGDIANSVANNKNHSYLMPCFTDFKKTFGNLMDKMFPVFGNHEYNCKYAQRPTWNELYQKLNAQNEWKIGNLDGYGDYTVDLKNKGIRIICCNTPDRATDGSGSTTDLMKLTTDQCKWACARLEDTPSGYDVIFLTHRMLKYTVDTDQHQITWSLYSDATPVTEAINAFAAHDQYTYGGTTYNYTGVTGKMICCLVGHTHQDALYTLSSGVPVIMTTSDSCRKRSLEYDWDAGAFTKGTEQVGTVDEQAFEVVTIDRKNRVIYLNRIGYGNDRTFSY